LRREVVLALAETKYDLALIKAKELMKNSKILYFHRPRETFYSYTTDSLLLVKCYIRESRLQLAEESLELVWAMVNQFFKDNSFKIVKINPYQYEDNERERIENYFRNLQTSNRNEAADGSNVDILLLLLLEIVS